MKNKTLQKMNEVCYNIGPLDAR